MPQPLLSRPWTTLSSPSSAGQVMALQQPLPLSTVLQPESVVSASLQLCLSSSTVSEPPWVSAGTALMAVCLLFHMGHLNCMAGTGCSLGPRACLSGLLTEIFQIQVSRPFVSISVPWTDTLPAHTAP